MIDIFEEGARRDPRMSGELHPAIGHLWLFETPTVRRLPAMAIPYTIDDENGVVYCWNLYALKRR